MPGHAFQGFGRGSNRGEEDRGCQEGQGPFLGGTADCDAFAALVSDPDRARVTVRD
jgi:hypothetical protein